MQVRRSSNHCPSLQAWLEHFVDSLEAGLWRLDEGGRFSEIREIRPIPGYPIRADSWAKPKKQPTKTKESEVARKQRPQPQREPVSQGDALLHAILADPDDDAPCLVYADWLEEHGDPRGEFIRLQIQIATLSEEDVRRPALEQRECELLEAHGKTWRQEVPSWARSAAFR